MKLFLSLLLVCTWASLCAAQTVPDDLSVTLPTGKVLTFQTPEQKAKYLAARDRLHQSAAADATAAAAALPARPAASLGSTALDDKPPMSGKVNVSAPVFSADYYLYAPETWVGKQVTVSIAYLVASRSAPREDGMREFEAVTYGATHYNGEQSFGGEMKVLATGPAADRIASLCGTTLRWNGAGMRLSLVKGQYSDLSSGHSKSKSYGIVVTQ